MRTWPWQGDINSRLRGSFAFRLGGWSETWTWDDDANRNGSLRMSEVDPFRIFGNGSYLVNGIVIIMPPLLALLKFVSTQLWMGHLIVLDHWWEKKEEMWMSLRGIS